MQRVPTIAIAAFAILMSASAFAADVTRAEYTITTSSDGWVVESQCIHSAAPNGIGQASTCESRRYKASSPSAVDISSTTTYKEHIAAVSSLTSKKASEQTSMSSSESTAGASAVRSESFKSNR